MLYAFPYDILISQFSSSMVKYEYYVLIVTQFFGYGERNVSDCTRMSASSFYTHEYIQTLCSS